MAVEGPSGQRHVLGGLELSREVRRYSVAAMVGSQPSASLGGRSLATPLPCGCNWLSSSLSLPVSLCVFLPCVCLSLPCPCASLPFPLFLSRLSRLSGGIPPFRLTSSCTWSCLLSRCLPQEVGTWPVLAPHTRRGAGVAWPRPSGKTLGAGAAGPELADGSRKGRAQVGRGPVPGAQARLSLLVCFFLPALS